MRRVLNDAQWAIIAPFGLGKKATPARQAMMRVCSWRRSVGHLRARDIIPVIPPKSNRKFPVKIDRETCKWRHLVESYFGKLKENRGTAMRSC